MAPSQPHSRRRVPFVAVGAACAAAAVLTRAGRWCFATGQGLRLHGGAARGGGVAVRALDYSNPAALEELMKDPEKMKAFQAEMDAALKDPAKKAALERWSSTIQSGVEKLRQDPEMQEFFKDVEANGIEAMKKYEKDERILRKFSEATGGPEALGMMDPSMMAGAAAGAPPPPPSFKPGDEVIIRGLKAKPELNGKKAMVVPPTTEEREKLKGTGRMIVRLMDTGDQFAVKPDNLRTVAEEAGEVISNKLEDVSMYNPALQTEAAKLRESGKLEDLQNDPELKPIFEDIRKNGMAALEKYWNDDALMAKISKAMGSR